MASTGLFKPRSNDLTYQVSLNQNTSNLRVIILTRKRSGSSFVGEFLNQNPNMFYVFEPLVLLTQLGLTHYIEEDVFDEQSSQILNSTILCNFPKMPSGWWKYSKNKICKFNRAIMQTNVCKTSLASVGDSTNSILSKLSEICRKYKYIGIKTIRLTDISLIKQLMTSSNIKIIHLVRDPRGTMSSRMKLREPNFDFMRKKGKTGDEIDDLCSSINRNLKYVSDNSEIDWLKDRYKLIRYEDVGSHPRESAEDIYKFLGIPFPEEVEKWIVANTNSSSGGGFSHTRDSKAIIHAWRERLDLSYVLRIQGKCTEVMSRLGYTNVDSEFQLHNFSYPVMSSLPLSTVSEL